MLRSQLVALFVIPCALVAGAAGVMVGVRYQQPIHAYFANFGKGVPATAMGMAEAPKTLYTCGMHHQVIRREPGVCPICGMELVPLENIGGDVNSVTIDPVVVQNMGLRVAKVEEGELKEVVHAVGTLTEPEQNHVDVNLRVSGWIQKLYANQEGMGVVKGEPLFDLFSPEVTAAADELITARRSFAGESGGVILTASKRKLELLGLTAEQVEAISKMEKAPATIAILSPMNGHVAEKMVVEGSAVKAGERVMKIADRSTMWLIAQVYEEQLPLVEMGAAVKVKMPAEPGKVLDGNVEFIYPHLDMETRTAKVRVVLKNPEHRLHENMYGTADIEVGAGVAGGGKRSLMIPREAVIDTGRRQFVFVADVDNLKFSPVDVEVGRTGRDATGREVVQVLDGLDGTETVVTSGQFLIDSESRFEEAMRKQMSVGLAVPPPQPPGK